MRDHSIDNLKTVGMFLVFYYHFIEFFFKDSEDAMLQGKLICSFVVQLFFFLSGIFFRPGRASIFKSIVNKLRTRIVPMYFFGFLSLIFYTCFATEEFDILGMATNYALGIPVLNWPTWFLVALFNIEIVMLLAYPFIASYTAKNILVLVFHCLLFGWILSNLPPDIGFERLTWYWLQVPTAFAFYILGYTFKDKLVFEGTRGLTVLLVSGLILLATFNLNEGYFDPDYPRVFIVRGSIGHPLWFVLTSVAGILFVVSFSKLFLKKFNFFSDFVGKHMILYLGLNGLCLNYLNGWLVQMIDYTPQGGWSLFLYGSAYSVLMLLILMPVVLVLKKYFNMFFLLKS